MKGFGTYVRAQREKLSKDSKDYSVRKVAGKIGVEPAFLSKVEREVVPPEDGQTLQCEALGALMIDPAVRRHEKWLATARY